MSTTNVMIKAMAAPTTTNVNGSGRSCREQCRAAAAEPRSSSRAGNDVNAGRNGLHVARSPSVDRLLRTVPSVSGAGQCGPMPLLVEPIAG